MYKEFFPKRVEANPKIYAYSDSQYKGMLKIGYTVNDVKKRVAEQYPIIRPGKQSYTILLDEIAMRSDGSTFTDHDVHRYLKRKGFKNEAGEWFKCTLNDVKAALIAIKNKDENEDGRTMDFGLRPEQKEAIDKTITYFKSFKKENTIKHHIFCGMPKCVLAKLLPHTNWLKNRTGKKY